MPIYETTIKLKPHREDYLSSRGIEALLELIFYRAKGDEVIRALKFLEYIKQRRRMKRPYHISEWKKYLKDNNLTQTQYYNTYKRLLGAGLLRVEKGFIVDCEEFTMFLVKLTEVWNAWRAS